MPTGEARPSDRYKVEPGDVAIKVLPDVFAQEPDRLLRFTRESQVLASLNQNDSRAPTSFWEGSGIELSIDVSVRVLFTVVRSRHFQPMR